MAQSRYSHFFISILNSSFCFPYTNVESPRAEGIEREADNTIDQTILLIQQCCWEFNLVAWQCKLVLP